MINSFFGLEMGKRAMDYFRQGMDTAGHNISNADTEGYARQRVEASTTDPFAAPGVNSPALPGQIGTGVKVDSIVRLRDEFLDLQYKEESTVKGYWDVMAQTIDTLETFVNEPNGDSIRDGLDEFWSALQEVSKHPDSSSARENLISKTGTLSTYLESLSNNYDQYRDDINDQVELKVKEANSYIDQIAALNTTIKQVEGAGGNPNDLYDRRDLLTEKLSTLADIEVGRGADNNDGEYKVYLDGRILVQGEKARHLELVAVAGNEGYYDVQVEDNTFDIVSDTSVLTATVDQQAAKAVHSVSVRRVASETSWKVGGADINGSTGRIPSDSADSALSIEGTLRLQVGGSGLRTTGSQLDNTAGSPVLLKTPSGDDETEYTFRIASQDLDDVTGSAGESYITVEWDTSVVPAGEWRISSRTGTDAANIPPATTSASGTFGTDLSLDELQSYLNSTPGLQGNIDFSVETSGSVDRLVVESGDDHILSFSDMQGDFLSSLVGISNDSPEVTIEIDDTDSLNTIANKINGAYQNGDYMPSDPDQWLHASVEHDQSGDYYLVLESNVVGESSRINIMGSSKGDTYAARRLGLMGATDSTDPSNTYYTSLIETSTDAAFTVDNDTYLSSVNEFSQARQVTAEDEYAVSEMGDVVTGISFQLKNAGESTITSDHHVMGGEIKALLESRDDVILQNIEEFDTLAYGIATEINAIHYAGHGTGDYSNVTGTAFFTPMIGPKGASGSLTVNSDLEANSSLLAAAADDGDGNTKGEGNGDNAIRLAQLKQAKVLAGNSATFNEYYEDFIAGLGVSGQEAASMLSNQTAMLDQIDGQRQSVMGVNIDEEMMDVMKFQNSFNAISRYITTLDDMLDKVINGMGRVGL